MDIRDEDLRIEVYRPPNSVRVTHLPTGIQAESWGERSQLTGNAHHDLNAIRHFYGVEEPDEPMSRYRAQYFLTCSVLTGAAICLFIFALILAQWAGLTQWPH